jgi:hypothetical protein
MNEPPPNAPEAAKATFSENYRSPTRCGVIWVFLLALWCSLAADMGESLAKFIFSLGGYLVLLILVMLRRPTTPTDLDLLGSADRFLHRFRIRVVLARPSLKIILA